MNTKRGDNTWVAKCGKLGEEIEALRFELAKTSQDLQYWYKEAERRLDDNNELRATKDEAVALVYEGNEIIKEAMEEIRRLNEALSQAKAAGAREALQRAMEEKGFSKAYVSVNTLQAVIADMESAQGCTQHKGVV